MLYFILFAVLIGHDYLFSRFVAQMYCSSFAFDEICALNLAPIDQ